MPSNILGLDLGTNSIGWALISQDLNTKSGKIISAGSRIIPMSQDALSEFNKGVSISQTAERTRLRGIRRIRERHLLRRERLHRILHLLGFLPAHYSQKIDFRVRLGQFLPEAEPKLPYSFNIESNRYEFLFTQSFTEMMQDFHAAHPELLADGKKIPYDWTLYYLRRKALTQKIEKEELAWIILNFNQKRGYHQLRGEEQEEKPGKLVELHSLLVVDVIVDASNTKGETWYSVHLENGWIYRRTSKMPLDWKGKIKDFIVTTELDDTGNIKKDKEGREKRSFKAPDENDWTLSKKKTEKDIAASEKTVGEYIYTGLLKNPAQKIKGKLVRVVERSFYKDELKKILEKQLEFHPELSNTRLYKSCIQELYKNNEAHKTSIANRGFVYLLMEDIIFYQRPLKSKVSLISDCKYETRTFFKNGSICREPLKCIAKSHPLFQEFRLWQFIQNVRIIQREKEVDGLLRTDVDVTKDFLTSGEDWQHLFTWLNDRMEIDQKSFLKYPAFNLKKNIISYRWNYVEDKVYPCNETRAQILHKLSKVEGITEGFLTKKTEEALWHILYSVEDKDDLQKALATFADKNGIGPSFVNQFRKFPPFKKDYGSLSAKAIKKLLPLMRAGSYWSEEQIDKLTMVRIDKILTGEYDEQIIERVREKALHLGKIKDFNGLPVWLASYIVYNRHSEDGSLKAWKSPTEITLLPQHSLRNPIVEKVINETLQLVRDIWTQLGKGEEDFFHEIHVELGREMKKPAEERRQLTNQINENENTNLRIKALLAELLNDPEVENVRPYSPMQQEILKIYEEGVLAAETTIPDEIMKISKQAQPTSSELTRYKLWLQQRYRSPYTGEIIPLSKLFTRAYDIEHIIPQSRYYDNSFSNKVICESVVNGEAYKGNRTAYEFISEFRGKIVEELTTPNKTVKILGVSEYEDFIRTNYSRARSKMKKLLMEDIPETFIQRQMNDSRYISKTVATLLSNIVREDSEQETISKKIVVSSGGITAVLKQDWGLNAVWNEMITPRFEALNELTGSKNFGDWTNKEGKIVFQTQVPLSIQKGFNKKRIDHRHHALDAILIACATRNHINYLNNISGAGSGKTREERAGIRYDLRYKLCFKEYNNGSNSDYRWTFYKPWQTFTQDTKAVINTIIVSFKQNLRVINKTRNRYLKWGKDENGLPKKQLHVQANSDHWAIRKPIHKETVSGVVQLKLKKEVSLSVALDDWEMIVDSKFKDQVKDLIGKGYNKKELQQFFKEVDFVWNGKNISRIEIYYWDKEIVASRSKIDESFGASKINSITDSGITKILQNHLDKFDEEKGDKKIEHPEIAFSPDGLEELNKNIRELNGGKPHHPIFKARIYELKGKKFAVGQTGNKKQKFVETATGTNLFFGVYRDSAGKRCFETIPLNIVIERQKHGLPSIPEKDEQGRTLLFSLSPYDLIYVPGMEELELSGSFRYEALTPEQRKRIYKVVNFSGGRLYAVPHNVAAPIVDRVEFTQQNKLEFTYDRVSIREHCIKLLVDRLGNIKGSIS